VRRKGRRGQSYVSLRAPPGKKNPTEGGGGGVFPAPKADGKETGQGWPRADKKDETISASKREKCDSCFNSGEKKEFFPAQVRHRKKEGGKRRKPIRPFGYGS